MARIAAKVKVTHKMLGARSTLEAAVGSRPKLNTTSTSTTKTAAERIAVRERNSTSRSLEATVQAWRRSLGDCITIVLAHLLGTSPAPRSEMREAARAHECDVGRGLCTFIDIVGHQDGSPAFGGILAQQLPQLLGSHPVETGEGLVQEQDARVMDQRSRDGGSLYQAARQLAHPPMLMILQTETTEKTILAEEEFTFRYVVQRRPETQILAHRELAVELRLVADPADRAASALDLRPPALRQDQTRENFEEGRLPGAVRTEHRKRLAGLDAERNVVEGPDRTEAVPQSFSQQHRSRPRARSVHTV